MDGSRFDQLARAMGSQRTRRGFLGSLAVLVAGATGLRTAEAKCPPNAVAASGGRCLCKATGRVPGPSGCPCPTGQTSCDGDITCKDLSSDVANCGACGEGCTAPANSTAACVGGVCEFACGAGYTLCGGVCVDTNIDETNCGGCGNICTKITIDQSRCSSGFFCAAGSSGGICLDSADAPCVCQPPVAGLPGFCCSGDSCVRP